MGLATSDPHGHKVHTNLYKIPKFGVNGPKSKQDSHLKISKFTKKCNVWPSGRCPTQCPDGHTFLC